MNIFLKKIIMQLLKKKKEKKKKPNWNNIMQFSHISFPVLVSNWEVFLVP